jgi:hypothetical protein
MLDKKRLTLIPPIASRVHIWITDLACQTAWSIQALFKRNQHLFLRFLWRFIINLLNILKTILEIIIFLWELKILNCELYVRYVKCQSGFGSTTEPEFLNFKGLKNRFQGIHSASLFSLASRYENPIPTRFLATP